MPIVGHKIETTTDNFGNLVRKNCLLVDKTVKKNQSMKKLALAALEQINQKAYSAELMQCPQVKQVLKVGLAFRDKSVFAAYEMENRETRECDKLGFYDPNKA